MLVQGSILQGEGSTVPVESHHTPSDASTTSQPPLSSPFRIPTRQETKVPRPSSPTHTHIANEAASTGVDVRHRGAATTLSSLDTRQDSGNIDKTPSIPHDSPLPRVNTLGSDEGSMTLMNYGSVYKIFTKGEKLGGKLEANKEGIWSCLYQAYHEEDPFKQGRSMIEEIDQDAEVHLVTPTQVLAELAKVHTYTRRRRTINTAEESVSTTSTSMPVSTDGIVDKGKAIIQESEPELTTTKLQQRQERADYEAIVRLQERLDKEERKRIARVHEEASSFYVKE
nr:hypothetical protein [Tanacetum cinerariifolium]